MSDVCHAKHTFTLSVGQYVCTERYNDIKLH